LPSRKLKVTLTRSSIGLKPGHVRTLQALGLRRIRATVVHDDTPVIRGMIARVAYAVRVEPVESHDTPVAGRGHRDTKSPTAPTAKERSA
jgi:large subunit ribosomal protein L30